MVRNPEKVTGDEERFEVEAFQTKRVGEFVYGVISAMLAIAGLVNDESHMLGGVAAAGVVVSGAAAIWLAHSYADWLGEHARAQGGHGFRGILHSLRASWPVVIAGFIVATPVLLSEMELYSVSVGLALGNAVGLLMLFGLGLAAAALAEMSLIRTVGMAAFTTGIGLAIIGVEHLLHH